MSNDGLIFHQINSTAIRANPDNFVGILVDAHYILVFETINLLKSAYFIIRVNYAQTCCSSDIELTGRSFQGNPDFVACKTVLTGPAFYFSRPWVI